ncbi:MAG: hypothetical protein JXR70_17045 [Spirochaetales bacterium]|nr:hypothetical protein [Spirochaetales bacterium]
MFKWIEGHPKSLAALLVLILGCLWIFILDFSLTQLIRTAPLFAAFYLLIFYTLRKRKNQFRLRELSLREYREHQEISIDAIEDIFQEEKAEDDFGLPVMLKGISQGDESLKSPLSQNPCLAYHLRVELLNPSDLSNGTYSYLLINKDKSREFKLQQNEKTISIAEGGFCQFRNSKNKNFTWSYMSRLPEELKQIIEEELKLKNMDKSQFSGFRVIEEIFNQGESTIVYGICKKSSSKLMINGNHKLDHPESLTITTISRQEREEAITELKNKSRRNSFLFMAPALLLLIIPLYFFAQPKLMKSGVVYYVKSDIDVKIEITDFSSEPGENYWWTFGATDNRDKIELWNADNEDLHAYSKSQLVISQKLMEDQIYEVGVDKNIQWKGSYYYFEASGDLPEPAAAGDYHKGRIYLKNKSSQKVKITFDQKAREISSESYWTWNPWDGMKYDYGNYAIKNIYNDKEEIIEEKEILLETGDPLFLYINNQLVRSITLGASKELPFVPNTGWSVIMDEHFLKPRKGPIYYKNPSEYLYTLKILDSQGNEAYAATWDLEAGNGMDEELGRYLILTDSAGKEEDILITEGMFLKISRIRYKELLKGSLDELPQVDYNYLTGQWTIDLLKEP